jgi:type III pantothenate kinase
LLAALAALPQPPTRAVGSTVVAGGLDGIARALHARGVALEVAGRELVCPLELAYATPATLGTDRWLVALAAWRAEGAAIVVQCGTAITADAVDARGRFLGGAIAPGLRAMAKGLAGAAPALPEWSSPDEVLLPATTSQASVDAGVTLAFCGAVERLTQDLRVALPQAKLLLTGGDAQVFVRHGRVPCTHVPDLLHQGLRWLAETSARPC